MDIVIPLATPTRAFDLAPLRIRLTYLWRHGRLPDLDSPQTFTELVQARKLTCRDARMPQLADKVGVKDIVAAQLGTDWVIPTLWHGDTLPLDEAWPRPFVVKSRHGCNQNAFLRNTHDDWAQARRQAHAWGRGRYGYWLDEWLYTQVPRGILVEPFVGPVDTLPIDYKFYVFGGQVEFVQVHLGRGARHRWIVFDRDWTRVSSHTDDPDPQRPDCLREMIAGAETLGAAFDFVRVDLYDIDGRPRFGEMTFYPGSGLDPFDPPSLDQVMGDRWLTARQPCLRTNG